MVQRYECDPTTNSVIKGAHTHIHAHTQTRSTHSSNTLLAPRLSMSMQKCFSSSSSSAFAWLSSHRVWYKTSPGLLQGVFSAMSSSTEIFCPSKNSPKKNQHFMCAFDTSSIVLSSDWTENVLKPVENSSRVRYPLPSESRVSNTFSNSSALRGSSSFSLYLTRHKTQLL